MSRKKDGGLPGGIRATHNINIGVAIGHRSGHLEVGEIAVVIAAAAPHRAAAFEACRFAIDTLKQTVPIWKKEVATDGEYWVDDRP